MLLEATILVRLITIATTLWMSFYLFARGFASKATLRAVIILLALTIESYIAYSNLFHPIPGSAALRSELLVIGLTFWYSLICRLTPERSRQRGRWIEIGMYGFAALTMVVLLRSNAFIESGNPLYGSQLQMGATSIVYGLFQLLIVSLILFNLLAEDRVGLTSRGKFFLIAALFPTLSVLYGIVDFFADFRLPHVIPTIFNFIWLFFVGLSVARHQTLTERRTTYQDFPLSTLVVMGFAGVYLYFASRWGVPVEMFSFVIALAVLTHGIYDLTREFLERLRMRHESRFRKQLHDLENDLTGEQALKARLQEGLDLLCKTLRAPSGLAAVRTGENFTVLATQASLPVGSGIPASLLACEDVSHPPADQLPSIAWIAPSFEGQQQVAVVGIGGSITKMEYSSGDLDLLAETADHLGTLFSLSNLRSQQNDVIRRSLEKSQENANEMNVLAEEMLDTMESNLSGEFVKHVEDALRNLPDTIKLGQSPLAEKMFITEASHIERGKRLQQMLTGFIEALKPAEKRPPEPLPRMWYNHAVLYDAYVEGVPNREIMSRLYISEGTFNRTRRNAIRGLARLLMERTVN